MTRNITATPVGVLGDGDHVLVSRSGDGRVERVPAAGFTAETAVAVGAVADDNLRLLLHEAGVLQAPPHVDPLTVAYPAFGTYDAEQGGYDLNLPATSPSKALAVALGSNKPAMWFGTRADGTPALWMDQTGRSDAVMTIANPGLLLTSPTVWSLVVKVSINTNWTTRIFRGSNQIYSAVDSTGRIQYFDDVGNGHTSASTLTAVLGWQSGDDVFLHYKLNGTALVIEGSLDGMSWATVTTNAMPATSDMTVNPLLYLGLSAFVSGSCFRGQWLDAKLHDGDRTDPVVAHFTPTLFPAGNRTNGATAVDEHDVTWTLTKPTAASTDEPRVVLPGPRRFVLPGVAGESISTPDRADLSFATGVDIRVSMVMPSNINASGETIVAKYGASGQQSFMLRLQPTKVLNVYWTPDGSSVRVPDASPVIDVAAGEWFTLRIRLIPDGDLVYSLLADDGVTWDVLSTVSPGVGAAIFDSTAALEVGEYGGVRPLNAELGWVELRSADGTLVERIDPADADPDAYTFVSSTSGATVTVNHTTAAGYKVTLAEEGDSFLLFDSANDFARVIGDLTVTDFDPAVGLTLIADVRMHNTVAPNWGRVMSSAEPVGDHGASMLRFNATPAIYGRISDGSTAAQVGDNGDNVTYGVRTRVIAAYGSSDHEAYTDGISRESNANAVAAEPATEMLHFGRRADGAGPLAFELHGFVVIKRRLSDSDAATITTEMGF